MKKNKHMHIVHNKIYSMHLENRQGENYKNCKKVVTKLAFTPYYISVCTAYRRRLLCSSSSLKPGGF